MNALLMKCKNCGEPIDSFPTIKIPGCQWKHASGHYACNHSKPMHSVTYAEPEDSAVKP